jgi:hypothetical protein
VQFLAKCRHWSPDFSIRETGNHADQPQPLRLLRSHTKRPSRRTTDKGNELAPLHLLPHQN